jgi:hypothetical protein
MFIVTKVKINNYPAGYPPVEGLLQTHSNWVSKNGNFFYIGNSHSGGFVEVDIGNKRVLRKLFVDENPEQSIS